MTRAVVVAVHGILTRTTEPSWPDHLDAYLFDCKVERRDYFSWPLPIVNVLVKNRIEAHALAAEIELVVGAHAGELPLHFVAHSNGCDIALRAIKLLAKRGITVQTAIFTGSVLDPDIGETGIAQLVADGHLERAFAYCSADDVPLWLPFKWPYKDLGRRGFKLKGRAFDSLRIRTRWFSGGHSCYFEPAEKRLKVFAQMRADMRLA